MKKIQLASPHMCGEEQKYIQQAFDTNWLAPLGPNVNLFEEKMKKRLNVGGAVALSSGTAAIHMALKAVGVQRGDIIFCSDLTFAASCNPILYEGCRPVFIDSEPDTWNMSPKALEKAFNDTYFMKPKAVIVVHLYGQAANMDKIKDICDYHNVPIIEDAAEALGSYYKGKALGTIGDYGVFSFNGNKIITTTGGGMLVSNNESALEKVKFWSTQAKDKAPWYQHSEVGYNYRLSNVLAGIGVGQLSVLNERVRQKQMINIFYRTVLENIKEIELPPVSENYCNYWLSCILLSDESTSSAQHIINRLADVDIEARRVWKPMHLQPLYKKCRFVSHFNHPTESVSEDIFKRGICLPSDTKMTYDDLLYVFGALRKIIKESEENESKLH